MTRNSSRSEIVQLEIAIAGTHKISVIPIIEQGVILKGALFGIEYLKLDERHPEKTFEKVSIYLKKLKKQKE